MLSDILQNRYAVTAVILFGVGFTNLMLQQNLLRKMMSELKGKADNLKEEEGYLQLLSGATPIGDRIRLPAGTGGTGREIELRNNGTAIEWRYTDSNEWTELVKITDLSGKDGETPEFEIREGHLIAKYKN